jgi:Resolvase, N terminal domain
LTAHFGKFVAYYRVSTDKQGQSGVGLDAQRQAVMTYLNGRPWKLMADYTELETRALFAGSQGGTVAPAGGNTCGPEPGARGKPVLERI